MDYTYIGECKCIVTRIYHHNSGHGSTSTILANRPPFAIMEYICGFDGKIRHCDDNYKNNGKKNVIV